MDRLRTLLLARARTLVLDPDRVASAATRPSRDVDVERFEDELVQLGYVMSLDLAMTVRRLPHQAIQDLKAFMLGTLGGEHHPRRAMADYTVRDQPCPWCGQVKRVGALDPCGHLVCRTCWDAGSFVGCPICHRRVAMHPFAVPAADAAGAPQLRLIDLAFDAPAVARDRFERMIGRTTPLSADDRAEIETVIDVIGPRAAIWMPSKIGSRETMAVAIARLWTVSPDRVAMVKATQGHLATATDVLRVAVVLMGGNPALIEPMRLRSLPRALRRSILQALDRLSPESLLEDMRRCRGLWKRVGERLHPFELADKHPTAALAFAALRGTDLATATFAEALRRRATGVPGVHLASRVVVTPWAGPVEAALRAGDLLAATAQLATRPAELFARVDHLLRLATTDQARQLVVDAVRAALPQGAPLALLRLAGHANTAISQAVRSELLRRAGQRKAFARAVLDRALADVAIPGSRSTMLDIGAIHAAARANVLYIRERDATITTIRRREGEATSTRLARVYDNPDADSQLSRIPAADAPTWVALLTCDLALPRGSAGYVHDRSQAATVQHQSADDLIAELAAKP